MAESNPILLIDSTCKLCSKSMQFVVNNGGEDKFEILSIYDSESKELMTSYGLPPDYNKSLVLIENGKAYIKSTAVLRISRHLKGPARILYLLIIFPKFLRDPVYNFISRHRHKLYR